MIRKDIKAYVTAERRKEMPKCFFCRKELDKQYKTIKIGGYTSKTVCNDCEFLHGIIHKAATDGRWNVIRDIYYFVVEKSFKDECPKITKRTGRVVV